MHARGAAQQLTLLTLLKCQQHLGYLPAPADVPDQIRTYLCQQLHLLPLMDVPVEAEKTLYRYRHVIREGTHEVSSAKNVFEIPVRMLG